MPGETVDSRSSADLSNNGIMRRRRVHAVLTFPAPLPIEPSVLGERFDIKVGEIQATVQLPILDESVPDWPRLAQPATGPDSLRALAASQQVCWGHGFNSSWEVERAVLTMLVSPRGEQSESPEVRSLIRSFHPWFEIARRWLLVHLKTPAHRLEQSTPGILWGAEDGNPWGRGGVLAITAIEGRRGGTREELASAFARAAHEEHLPVEWELLLEAQTFLFQGDHRRAVIDAATAAEVVLAGWTTYVLMREGLSGPSVSAVLRRVNGIAEHHRLAASLGLSTSISRKRVIDQLADPRNSAVHSADRPSPEMSRRAISCARELVEALAPLSFP